MNIKQKIAIIGAGKMGQAFANGLLIKKVVDPSQMILTRPEIRKLEAFKKIGVRVMSNNCEAVKMADIIIMSVKPQVIKGVLSEIQPFINKNNLLISIAAGITIDNIEKIVGKDKAIIRAMPNLAAKVGESMSGWVKNPSVTKDQEQIAQAILQAIGQEVILTNEDQLNAVTAISGSGPAYFLYVTELLEDAGKKFGLPADIASTLARQTAIGTACLLQQSNESAEGLRKSVTSPGGTTEAAFMEFQKRNLQDILIQGVRKAFEKSKQLDDKGVEER